MAGNEDMGKYEQSNRFTAAFDTSVGYCVTARAFEMSDL